jgi:hypothetical protein
MLASCVIAASCCTKGPVGAALIDDEPWRLARGGGDLRSSSSMDMEDMTTAATDGEWNDYGSRSAVKVSVSIADAAAHRVIESEQTQ